MKLPDDIDRDIYVLGNGAIEYQSILEKEHGRRFVDRLLAVVEDNIIEDGDGMRINWRGVEGDWERMAIEDSGGNQYDCFPGPACPRHPDHKEEGKG